MSLSQYLSRNLIFQCLFSCLFLYGTLTHASPSLEAGPLAELSRHSQWRKLLHCTSSDDDKCESAIKDPDWFISESDDALQELQATVAAFNATENRALEHRCRFPARYEWLRQQLPEDIPELAACPELLEWYAGINPESLTLIFPSSFLNNPASAFGHTLLRIEPANHKASDSLLAYSINFEADTLGDSAIPFMFKGVFGGYSGYFSVAPFADKVTKYSEMENRDIWEFPLRLSSAQVRRVVLHVYELRRAPFNYHYFDENCSFYLLSLLEVAEPAINLQKHFPLWVIPVDTVRVLQQAKLLDGTSVFRPSVATRLKGIARGMDPHLAALARSMADPEIEFTPEPLSRLSEDQKAKVLEVADVYLGYSNAGDSYSKAARNRAWQILSLRSTLGQSPFPRPEYDSVSPEQGHPTMRVSTGVGKISSQWYTEYGLRPAFHEQLDPPAGYLIGSHMSFFDTVVRHQESTGLSLNRFSLLDIESLSAYDKFFAAPSWRLNAEYRREYRSSQDFFDVSSLQSAYGYTYAPSEQTLLFALLSAELQLGTDLKDGYAFGIGPRVGLLMHITEAWSLQGTLLHEQFFLGDEHTRFDVELNQRVSLSKNTALRFAVKSQRNLGRSFGSAVLHFDFYFSPLS